MAESDSQERTIDVEPHNVSQCVSLCGLKFEKLIWSNPVLLKELKLETLKDSPKFDWSINPLVFANQYGFGYNVLWA